MKIKINDVEYSEQEFAKMVEIAKCQARIDGIRQQAVSAEAIETEALNRLEPDEQKRLEAIQVVSFLKIAVN